MNKDIIITAGGFGRRLWPVSTYEKPKQFMSLEGEISFLQSTILRALKLHRKGYIIIVSRSDLHAICQEQVQELAELLSFEDMQNLLERLIIILEPFSNGTINSVLLGMYCLKTLRQDENSSVLLFPSDHVIGPFEYFEQDLKKGFIISSLNKIVCYGIEPAYPATNYGYIEKGEELKLDEVLFEKVYLVPSFQEKPELEKAKAYLEQDRYFWNTAIYTFPLSLMFEQYKKFQNDIYNKFQSLSKKTCDLKIISGIQTLQSSQELEDVYKSTPNLSFDFGITTHTKEACVVNASFSWEDVGNWDSFSSLFTPPSEKIVEIETKNNFIYSDIPVAICGLENINVIIKNGEALIMQKGKGELVKDAYSLLKNNKDNLENK